MDTASGLNPAILSAAIRTSLNSPFLVYEQSLTVSENATQKNLRTAASRSAAIASRSAASQRETSSENQYSLFSTGGASALGGPPLAPYPNSVSRNAAIRASSASKHIGVVLASAINRASGFISQPTASIPNSDASTSEVPVPQYGSSSRIPGVPCRASSRLATCGIIIAG